MHEIMVRKQEASGKARLSNMCRRKVRLRARHAAFKLSGPVLLLGSGLGAVLMGTSPATASSSAWAVASTPSPPGSTSTLASTSCVSSDFCVAVGAFGTTSALNTLVETFNGTSWSIVPSPTPTGIDALDGVSCTSSSFCLAVGLSMNQDLQFRSFSEVFSGSKWSIVPSPNPGSGDNLLTGVACSSSSSCVAVGAYDNGTDAPSRTLAATFNGSSWSVVSSPNSGSSDDGLASVSCVSSTDCVAVGSVGDYDNESGPGSQTLVETFNGSSWSITPSADGSADDYLDGVWCGSSGSCTAVGAHDNGYNTNDQSLAETFNGSSWSVVATPNEGSGDNDLSDVSCVSSNSCVAVGFYDNGNALTSQTLAETFDGSSWSVVSTPSPSSDSVNVLSGVSSAPSGLSVAVGEYGPTSASNALIETGTIGTTPAIPVQRIYGTDAIGTSIAVSQAQFPDAGSAGGVVLARSDYFSDALAGGPLAAAVGGPLLITPGASLSSALDPRVQSEIQRVLPSGKTVYVLGGTLALSPEIDTTLENLGYKVVRVAGNDAYATAAAIAGQLGDPSTVFEATSTNFADALSAVPAAIQAHGAILLTDGATQAPETAAYLAAHTSDTRYAIGGPLAASGADPTAIAVWGSDLYATSAAVAAKFFPEATTFGAATGLNFPDALSGGVFMGSSSHTGPMLLVEPSLPLPSSISGFLGSDADITNGYLFGGPLAVGDDVQGAL